MLDIIKEYCFSISSSISYADLLYLSGSQFPICQVRAGVRWLLQYHNTGTCGLKVTCSKAESVAPVYLLFPHISVHSS